MTKMRNDKNDRLGVWMTKRREAVSPLSSPPVREFNEIIATLSSEDP
jgi:hypothetical protein